MTLLKQASPSRGVLLCVVLGRWSIVHLNSRTRISYYLNPMLLGKISSSCHPHNLSKWGIISANGPRSSEHGHSVTPRSLNPMLPGKIKCTCYTCGHIADVVVFYNVLCCVVWCCVILRCVVSCVFLWLVACSVVLYVVVLCGVAVRSIGGDVTRGRGVDA